MPESTGNENLEEETSVEGEGYGEAPEGGSQGPSPEEDEENGKPQKNKGGGSPPTSPEEQETLDRIVASLGDAVLGKLKLRVQRRQKGQAWRVLRSITIEDWMVEDGLDVPEVIGEIYGNGFYRWQLRYRGRFVRKSDCFLEGYDDIPDNELVAGEAKPGETVDLRELLGGLKSELLQELRPQVSEPATPDSGELVQSAVEAAIKPIQELVSGLKGELASLFSLKNQLGQPKADPGLQALIGILSQQNTALFDLVARSFSERSKAAAAAANPVSQEDPFGASLKHLWQLTGIVNRLGGKGAQADPMPAQEEEEIVAEEEEIEGPEQPAPTPSGGVPPAPFSRVGAQMNEAVESVLGSVIKMGEEKIKSELLSPVPSQTPAAPKPGPSQIGGYDVNAYERLFHLLDNYIRKGATPEEFHQYILPRIDPQVIEILKTGKLSAADIGELSKALGKPDLTARVKDPEFQAYLEKVLEATRSGAKPGPA